MRFIVFAALWSLPLSAQITGGILEPAIDPPDRLFSCFRKPNDVLGALYAPLASKVTPEGYIWTGLGELMSSTGNPPEPVNQRLRTLRSSYLPVIEYDVARNSGRYRLFAADLGGALAGLPVTFAGIGMSNQTKEPRAAFLTSAFRAEPPVTAFSSLPEYRFFQRWDLLPHSINGGRVGSGAPPVRGPWKFSFAGNALLRDGDIIHMSPPFPWQRSLAIGDRGLRIVRYFSGEVEGDRDPELAQHRRPPMGAATRRVELRPGEGRTLWFRIPVAPSIAESSVEALQLANADPARQGATPSKTAGPPRNMLVREQGDDLYLYSAVSPEGLQPGKTIVVEREPSAFGPVDARLNATAAGFTVALGVSFRNPPKRIFIRIPWCFQDTSATADGRAIPLSGGAPQVAPGVRRVQVQGRIRADAPRLSYACAVEDDKSEYQRRYRKFLQAGEIEP
jgi:hypothetical protein